MKHLAEKISTTRADIKGERKLVRSFADVAGFMAMTKTLDPEDVQGFWPVAVGSGGGRSPVEGSVSRSGAGVMAVLVLQSPIGPCPAGLPCGTGHSKALFPYDQDVKK